MDGRQLRKQEIGSERSFRDLSRKVELTLKYQGPETHELLDESSAGEIVRALGESDMQARIDMHKHKLNELMIVKREGGSG